MFFRKFELKDQVAEYFISNYSAGFFGCWTDLCKCSDMVCSVSSLLFFILLSKCSQSTERLVAVEFFQGLVCFLVSRSFPFNILTNMPIIHQFLSSLVAKTISLLPNEILFSPEVNHVLM